jgi:hypothetical protein
MSTIPPEETLASGKDNHERAMACALVAARYRGSVDKRIANLLARIVANELEDGQIRLITYVALFEVVCRPLSDIPPLSTMRIPDDFDRAFVESYISERGNWFFLKFDALLARLRRRDTAAP